VLVAWAAGGCVVKGLTFLISGIACGLCYPQGPQATTMVKMLTDGSAVLIYVPDHHVNVAQLVKSSVES